MNVITEEIRAAAVKELAAAMEKHPLFVNLHEAYGVIKEELEEATDELNDCYRFFAMAWKSIKQDRNETALQHITRLKYAAERLAIEATQVSAMCIKAIESERKEKE
jgi:hypothetical protein